MNRLWKILSYVLGTLLILGSLSVIVLGLCQITYKAKISYVPNTIIYKKLQYWDLKKSIIYEVDRYIAIHSDDSKLSGGLLFETCDYYGLDIRLALIQGRVESHFGTEGLSRKTNSVWNQGAYDATTFDKIFNIYKYPHPDKSIEPYVRLICHNYKVHGKTEYDLLDKFVNKNGDRYASDVNYEIKLQKMWTDINHETALDSLLREYELLKAELKYE